MRPLHSALFLSICLSFCAALSDSSFDYQVIGWNGGKNPSENYSDFENEVASITSMVAKNGYRTSILNGGGQGGLKLQMTPEGDYFRNPDGSLSLVSNSLPEEIFCR